MPVDCGPLGGVVLGAALRASRRQRSRSAPRTLSQRRVTSVATGWEGTGTWGVVPIRLPGPSASKAGGAKAAEATRRSEASRSTIGKRKRHAGNADC